MVLVLKTVIGEKFANYCISKSPARFLLVFEISYCGLIRFPFISLAVVVVLIYVDNLIQCLITEFLDN